MSFRENVGWVLAWLAVLSLFAALAALADGKEESRTRCRVRDPFGECVPKVAGLER